MDPKHCFIVLFNLLLSFGSCIGARPLPLFPFISPSAFSPSPSPSPEPEPEPRSVTIVPLIPVPAFEHLPEIEGQQPSASPPEPELLGLPEMPNTGKWLPLSNFPPIPFLPMNPINPALPFLPIPSMPTLPGIPFVPPFPGVEQLQGWASLTNPSQPRMPFGSSGGDPSGHH